MEPGAQSPPGAKQQLLRNLRLGGLLVVLLVGLLGGYRIWQLQFSVREFTVTVGAARDVTGARNQGLFPTDELLRFFDFTLLAPGGEVLLQIPAPIEGAHTLQARGSERQAQLADARTTGVLHLPGADTDRLRFELGAPTLVDGTDSLRLDVTRQMADDLQVQRVEARMAVRNQHGDPVVGLGDLSDRLRGESGEPGAYAVRIELQDLLDLVHVSRRDSLVFFARTPSAEGSGRTDYRLAVPVRWFSSEVDAPHLLEVEQLRERVVVRAQPSAVQPRQVTSSSWDGELRVRGRDMDLVERAVLVGASGRSELQIVDRSGESITLRSTAGRLAPGRYGLELHDREGPLDFQASLVVALAFQLRAPADGATVTQGETLDIRWSAPPSAGAVEVQASSGGTEAWFDVYRGSASAGSTVWETEGLEPGSYRLRVRLPDRDDVSPLFRTVEIEAIPAVLVRLRFTLGGSPYGRISEVVVDGESVDYDASDPFLISLRLLPGRHTIQLRGSGIAPTQRQILVEKEGQVIALELEG